MVDHTQHHLFFRGKEREHHKHHHAPHFFVIECWYCFLCIDNDRRPIRIEIQGDNTMAANDVVTGQPFKFKVVAFAADNSQVALPAQPVASVDQDGTVTTQPAADGTGGVMTAGATVASPAGNILATSGNLVAPPYPFNVLPVPAPAAVRIEIQPDV